MSKKIRIGTYNANNLFDRFDDPHNFSDDPWRRKFASKPKKLVDLYAANARKHERMGEWIERIGWPKFFKMAEIPFTKYHIDDFTHAGESYKRSAQLKH